MISYDYFNDIEEDYFPYFPSNILEPTNNAMFEEEYIQDGENNNFSLEMSIIFQELFGNNNDNQKENDRTN